MAKKNNVSLQVMLQLDPQDKRDIICWCVQNDITITSWLQDVVRQKLAELKNKP